jgi:sugar phosphate isomerase/epimerase
MTAVSRRQFGSAVLAGFPMAAAMSPASRVMAGRVVVGVATSSFRELPRVVGRDNLDDVLGALREVGAIHVELALSSIEPAPPSVAPRLGGSAAYPRRIVLSPEEVAATNADAREALRRWRLDTPASHFAHVGRTLSAAGLTVHSASLAFNSSFTDEELDATFLQARSMGVPRLSSPLTMAMARRLARFAERHGVAVVIHNQVDGSEAGYVGTTELAAALDVSPAFCLKFDIGNIAASNRDAVAELRRHESRIAHVVVRDRLRNGGPSQPLGEGDTPVAAVMAALRTSNRPIPAFVDYDYVGLHSAADEVAAALAYLRPMAG